MRSVAARTSATVHQRCPVIIDRSSSSCPSVLSFAWETRRKKKECAPRYSFPCSAASHRPDDVATTVRAAEAGGAQVVLPATPGADLGVQAVLVDPTGAHFGAWQTGTFPGFTVWEEHGTPSWFELYTRDLDAAATFYATVFRMEITAVADSGDFRYSTLRHPGDERELAGIMDASAVLPDGVAAHWTTYWEVDDVDATSARVAALGGSVLTEPADSPYGRMATVTDPCGTTFRLRTA